MENLIARIRRMGFLTLIGVFLIIYLSLGIIYFQQGAKQKDLEDQITKMSLIVSRPLLGAEKLQAEYDEANRSLSPLAVPDILARLVGIAKWSGIDIDKDSAKFGIPSPGLPVEQKVGEGNYQVMSLKSIRVQGDYDDVMAFISDLDSGKTMKTMVLKKVSISQTEVMYEGEEADRRAEFRNVSSAVIAMMTANNITEIPDPINYASDNATNYMGDDPDTAGTMEGFPDISTTYGVDGKGYTGVDTPKDGYVLYQHDKISTDNTTQFETVSYITLLTTNYYYTCEADGTVRQFSGPDLATAIEHLGSEEAKIETIAILDVDLYTKSLEGG